MRASSLIVVAVCAILLSACGNKGPLVMPGGKPQSAPPTDQQDQPKQDATSSPGPSSS